MPHAERANTASFLEEVIHYIEELQAILGLAPQQRPPTGLIPMKQPQGLEFNQMPAAIYGNSELAAAAGGAGGGVTSAAYAAIAQQQQQQAQQQQQHMHQHQQPPQHAQQAQHAQQGQHQHQGSHGAMGTAGISGRLNALSNLTAEQASMLALAQSNLGDYSGGADLNAIIASARQRDGLDLNDTVGGGEQAPGEAPLGTVDQSHPEMHGKRQSEGEPIAGNPAATDSDGSDGRPLKKRPNR